MHHPTQLNPPDTVSPTAASRWRATLEHTITAAGVDPQARLLAVFDALRTWHADPRFRGCSFANAAAELAAPDHPARAVAIAHKQGLRDRITELVHAAGHPGAEQLVDQLLLLFEGATTTQALGTVSHAADQARATARKLLNSAP